MKTYLEIVNEVVGSTIKIRPGESIPMSTAMAAANRYASQAIDEAANRAEAKIHSDMGNNYGVIVDRAFHSKSKGIIKVKKLTPDMSRTSIWMYRFEKMKL